MDERMSTAHGVVRSCDSAEAARWSRVCDILYVALSLESEERWRYVEQVCADDERLRSEVKDLIAASEGPAAIDLPAIPGLLAALVTASSESSATRISPGARISHYEIIEKIGEGGMGSVFKAVDLSLGRTVAVKVISRPKISPESRHRFAREARAASALNHPHIITIFEYGSDRDVDFIAMEYVEGLPLDQVLRSGAVPVSALLEYALQVATALAKAHSAGIAHRDLKPANIMITSECTAKVLDFGLAKQNDAWSEVDSLPLTQAGMIVGTPGYMSPEQALGQVADSRSDIFSFGVILYELLCGVRPFEGADAASMLGQVVTASPKPLLEINPSLPAKAVMLVERCLTKNRMQRLASMDEAVLELSSAISSLDCNLSQITSHSREDAGLNPESSRIPRDNSSPALSSRSIAILPFANLTADKENEYFNDGLVDEIINALSVVPGLNVIARTSSFAFRGIQQDIRRVGMLLGVRTVLEGSVRRTGNRIRVTAQLIDTTGGCQLWANRYDREMRDIFALQDELAQAIVATLTPKLRLASTRRPCTANVDAYNEYLKGMYMLAKQTPKSMERASDHLNEAIALDPTFAAAYAGLGDFFYYMASHGLRPIREFMPLCKSAVSAALQLDEELPEAQVVRGITALTWDYDWNCAQRYFGFALNNERITPSFRGRAAFHGLVAFGRTEEAISQIEHVIKVDPLSSVARSILAYAFYAAGRHDEAIGEANRALELEDRHWPAYYTLALIYLEKGLISETIHVLQKGIDMAPTNTWITSLLAACRHTLGDRKGADILMQQVAAREYGSALGYAMYNAQSDPDRAANYLEQAINEHDPMVIFVPTIPFWARVRSLPRGPALLQKMNYPNLSSGLV